MNIAAKITSLTMPNNISIGQYVYEMLHPSMKSKFSEVKFSAEEWRYTDRHSGQLYRVYSMGDNPR
jgi:adenylate cyclase